MSCSTNRWRRTRRSASAVRRTSSPFPRTRAISARCSNGLIPSGIPVMVLGGGYNLLVSDKGIRGLVVKLGPGFDTITVDGDIDHRGRIGQASRPGRNRHRRRSLGPRRADRRAGHGRRRGIHERRHSLRVRRGHAAVCPGGGHDGRSSRDRGEGPRARVSFEQDRGEGSGCDRGGLPALSGFVR